MLRTVRSELRESCLPKPRQWRLENLVVSRSVRYPRSCQAYDVPCPAYGIKRKDAGNMYRSKIPTWPCNTGQQ